MSVFVPFKAFRPTKETLYDLTSKPYDVLNSEEARAEAEGNPISFYHVIRPEINFPKGYDQFAPEVYEKGKEYVLKLIEEGALIQDDKEHFYVYQIKMGKHVQTGLVGCASVDDYFNNIIKKHELTKPKIEASRKKHITTSGFTYEPVFFAHPKRQSIDDIIQKLISEVPLYGFISSDGNTHTIWKIDNEELVQTIITIFEQEVPYMYIADGHHRTAAGALAGRELKARSPGSAEHRYDYIMCVVFPHDQVHIMDYNRVVKDLNGLSELEFLNAIQTQFQVSSLESSYKPVSHNEIGMYLGGIWYKLLAKPDSFDGSDLIDHLGFTILSKQILEPVLNITDLRRDPRIDFVGGIRGLAELKKRVDSGEMKVAFAMFPITMEELMDIADRDLLLPPKVTWFEPKLRSGIFLHKLTD